jgi:hypothetical protein
MAYTYKPYEESEAVKRAKEALEAHNATKPADYTSNWQSQIDATLSQIQNRKPFAYDLNADALYQQYKDMATKQGSLAMMDTMGQAAALTGGYGSSYGQNVGQQAYNSYLQNLNDKVPELYQLALSRYNQEGEDLYNMYALLGDREANDYAKWQDLQNAYESERNYLTNLYDTERGYDYNRHTADQNFQYQLDRDAAADAQWQAQFDEAIRQYNQDYAFNERKYNDAQAASAGGGGGGGGGNSGGNGGAYDTHGYTTSQIIELQRKAGIETDGVWGALTQAAYDAGYRPTEREGGKLTNKQAKEAAISAAGDSYEGQILALQQMYNEGKISESQMYGLMYVITNPGK